MKVKELINKLAEYPMDMEVLIQDADTDWYLEVHVGPNGKWPCKQEGMPEAVYIYGNY